MAFKHRFMVHYGHYLLFSFLLNINEKLTSERHVLVLKNGLFCIEKDDAAAKLEKILGKRGNEEILEHERKRQVEIKCLEFEDELIQQGSVLHS